MKILKDYYKWYSKFSDFFKELTKETFTIDPFTPNISFGITELELNLKTTKLDDFLFKKIIYFIYFLKAKLSFLLEYKKNFLISLKDRNFVLLSFSDEVTALKNSDDTVAFLNSKQDLSSGLTQLKHSYFLKDGFSVVKEKIYPNFKKIKKIEFEKTEVYGRLNLKFKEKTFISAVNFVFSKEIKSQIYVSFRKQLGANYFFTSEPIELSKFKTITLNFEDCVELIISSTEPFNTYLTSLTCYGGTENVEFCSGYGILGFETELELKQLYISSQPELFFFKSKKDDFKKYQLKHTFIDFENGSCFTALDVNINNQTDFDSEAEYLFFAFSTDLFELDEFKVFGG